MRRRLALVFSLAFLVLFTGTLGGCKDLKRLMPAATVEAPEEGTPEYVIQKAIQAGMMDDFDAGWKEFRKWLHSQQLESPASELNWKQFNFNALHRNVKRLYLEDPTKPVFKVDYDEEIKDDEVKYFIVNRGSDMPTPVLLTRDPKAGNDWRIRQCSLGL